MHQFFKTNPSIPGFSDATINSGIPIRSVTKSFNEEDVITDDQDEDISNLIVVEGLNQQDAYFVADIESTPPRLIAYITNPYMITSEPIVFSKTHKATLYDYTPSNGLLFSGWNNGIPQYGYVTKQPNVYVYDQFKTNHVQYKQISSDLVEYMNERPLSFDLLSNDLVSDSGIRGHLTTNVYQSSGYLPDNDMEELQLEYESYTYDQLYQIIEALEIDPNPVVIARDSDMPYTKNMMIAFLLEYHQSLKDQICAYRPCVDDETNIGVRKLRSVGDMVYTKEGSEITTVGLQNTGDLVSTSATVFDGRCHIGQSDHITNADVLYFMKVSHDISEEDLHTFRMKDVLSNQDISNKTILFCNHKLYSFSNDRWVPVYRKLS